jgi:four helix bundle protein
VKGSRHRNFLAYKLAASLADDLHDLVIDWPSFERWSVGIQLVRAADSIGANIAEGLGRTTRPDERRFLVMARASLREVEHWLERARSRDLLGEERFEPRTTELARVLSGLIRSGDDRGSA